MIRVLIADDHPLIRSGVRGALARETGIEVVGEATSGPEARALCEALQPDVLLLDLSMPDSPILETLAFFRTHFASIRVLVLSAHDEDAFVGATTKVGVAGYLLKGEALSKLASAIRAVSRGETYFSDAVAAKIAEEDAAFGSAFELTSREHELLGLLAQAKSNQEIAEILGLADQTVRNYVSRIYEKLNLNSRAEVVLWAKEHSFGK